MSLGKAIVCLQRKAKCFKLKAKKQDRQCTQIPQAKSLRPTSSLPKRQTLRNLPVSSKRNKNTAFNCIDLNNASKKCCETKRNQSLQRGSPKRKKIHSRHSAKSIRGSTKDFVDRGIYFMYYAMKNHRFCKFSLGG